jgi:hypothetical protein
VADEQFVLNLTTLAAIGGIMGVLTGAISYLSKALIESKDKQILDLKEIMDHNEKMLRRENEYWRSFSVQPAEQARLEKMFPAPNVKDDEEEEASF